VAGRPWAGDALHQDARDARIQLGLRVEVRSVQPFPGSAAGEVRGVRNPKTWTCWSGTRGGLKNDPRAGTLLL